MGRANEYLQNNQIMLGIFMICFSVIYLVGIVGYFYNHRYPLLFSFVLIVGQTIYYIGALIWIIITDLPDLGYPFILFLLMWVTGLFIHASIIVYTWGLYGKVKNKVIA